MIKIGNVGAAGRIHAQVFKKVDGVLVPVGPEHVQDNIVTAGGLAALTPAKENILEFTSLSNVINLGEGTQAEQESVDTLADYVTRGTGTQTVVSTVDFDNFEGTGEDLCVRTYRVQHQFAPTGTDRNYTEIGLGPDGSNGGLHTYALFRDAAGDPAAITVRADEYFNITYTYQVQAYYLAGFRTSLDLNVADLSVATKRGGKFIGPFPVTGQGIQSGTEAWLALSTHASQNIDYRYEAGVSYTSEPLDEATWQAAIPQLVAGNRPSRVGRAYLGMVLGSGPYTETTGTPTNNSDGVMSQITHQLSAAGITLQRKRFTVNSSGPQKIAPGDLGDSTAYVYMWGANQRRALVALTKPIVVEPDMEFTIDESTGLAWTVNPAVNKPWIDPEG